MLLLYPALFQSDEVGLNVSFRDIPGAATSGITYFQAFDMAHDALVTAIDSYIKAGQPVPMPSRSLPNEVFITLPRELATKVFNHNTKLKANNA